MPLDGQFRENVIIQVKNGPVDFQPREPFSPLFGAMKKTSVMPELQITQEYLGHSIQLVYLAPMWEEFLQSDTYQEGTGSTVARSTDGSIYPQKYTAIAGVANIGLDTNWSGHHFAQANWYAFGRLAWNNQLTSEKIADEWIRLTFLRLRQTTAISNRIGRTFPGSRKTNDASKPRSCRQLYDASWTSSYFCAAGPLWARSMVCTQRSDDRIGLLLTIIRRIQTGLVLTAHKLEAMQ